MGYIEFKTTKKVKHLMNQGGLHNAHTNGTLGLPLCKPLSFHSTSQQTTKKPLNPFSSLNRKPIETKNPPL